jgi:hypothetical protein
MASSGLDTVNEAEEDEGRRSIVPLKIVKQQSSEAKPEPKSQKMIKLATPDKQGKPLKLKTSHKQD